MKLLDGRKIKKEILEGLREELKTLEKLTLVVIQVGSFDASNLYIESKRKMTEFVGIHFKHLHLSISISERELLEIIDRLNADDKVTGLMVQMPLPSHIHEQTIQNRILPTKDVDGLCAINMGLLVCEDSSALVSPTAQGIVDILDYYHIDIAGRYVVIVGRSNLVGKSVFSLLLNRDATVTVCHSKTRNLNEYTKKADILIVAVGKAKMIKGEDVKENAVVIDVGIHKDCFGKICGDVDFDSVKDKVAYITPVPGGIGQMTVANLAKNIVKAYFLGKKTGR